MAKKKELLHERARKQFKGKPVTTNQLASRLKVSKMQAAAGIAHLVMRGEVEPAIPPKTRDGISRWKLVGD